MRFFLAAKRTFCVITLYALKIRASFFKARFVANLDDYKCVACCKRVYSCGETIKKHEVSFFLSHPVGQDDQGDDGDRGGEEVGRWKDSMKKRGCDAEQQITIEAALETIET